jgi:hypothetical protein
MLEEAVRWVIIIIIFVFDPLAVLLLIAAQYTFDFRRKEVEDDNGERLRLERQEFERARAQRIVDNPGFTLDDIVPPAVEDPVEPVLEEPKYEDINQEAIDKEIVDSYANIKQDDTDKVIPDTQNKMFYPDELDDTATYVTKDKDGNQVRKYKQNEEQTSDSLWQRLRDNDT